MNALLAVIVALVGLVLYLMAANAKAAELGRLMFAAGVFALCFAFATRAVHLF